MNYLVPKIEIRWYGARKILSYATFTLHFLLQLIQFLNPVTYIHICKLLPCMLYRGGKVYWLTEYTVMLFRIIQPVAFTSACTYVVSSITWYKEVSQQSCNLTSFIQLDKFNITYTFSRQFSLVGVHFRNNYIVWIICSKKLYHELHSCVLWIFLYLKNDRVVS